jgi:hypothetical protein
MFKITLKKHTFNENSAMFIIVLLCPHSQYLEFVFLTITILSLYFKYDKIKTMKLARGSTAVKNV